MLEHDGEKCQACGRSYVLVWVAPDDVWAKISPQPFEGFGSGGLLCPDCAWARAFDAGIVARFELVPVVGLPERREP